MGSLSGITLLPVGTTLPPAGRLATSNDWSQRRGAGAPLRCGAVPRGSPPLALAPSELKGHTPTSSLAASQSSALSGSLPLPLLSPLLSPLLPLSSSRKGAPHTRGVPGARAFLEVSAPATAKWVLRLVSYYALLRIGVAKEANGGAIDNVQKFVARKLFGDPDAKREKEARKAAVKWKESSKGTLVRKLRVPSVPQGRKLLNSIASLLAEDDLFIDVASHKGCQVRRETAHSESVCCYNVRALFDELPTPHLELEITVFPAGPLTTLEYQKAQKLEGLLRKGNTI